MIMQGSLTNLPPQLLIVKVISYAGFVAPYGEWIKIINPSNEKDSIFVFSVVRINPINPINYADTLLFYLKKDMDGATGER